MKLPYLIILIIVPQIGKSLGGICRLTNDHKNYTCDGFKFSQSSISRLTRVSTSL